MNTPIQTSQYLLLFRGPCWDEGLSDKDLDQTMAKVTAWFEGLREQGKVKAGQALAREGRVVSATKQRTVADGPFAESKEAVGGYLLVDARNLEEATAIARSCPTVQYNITIEVRPVLDECPTFKRARERMLAATA